MFTLAAFLLSATANAQENSEEPAEPAEPAHPAPKKRPDKVYLEGGSVVTGEIISLKKGESVTVRMENGEENTIDWAVIEKIVHGKKTGTAGSKKKPKPSKTDCAEDDEDCTETTSVGAASGGVGLGVRGERVVHLKQPTSSATMMAIDGGFLYGTSTKSGTNLDIYGGGLNVNVTFRTGGKFPGEEGGSWHGFGVDLYGNVYGAGIVMGNTGAGMLMFGGGGALGYQFFTFGKMNDTSFEQHGFGVFLAGRVGVASSTVWFQGGNSSSTDAQYGPQVTLSFPSYNFGTSSRAAFYISGFVLPTGDFLFANIQLGGAFSL